jgi:PTH2 family peptidyl-tRNA hydrolase
MSEPKQVIVMRKDLNMRKGKMAAQASHASLAVILNEMRVSSTGMKVTRTLELKTDSAMSKWLSGAFAKICVSADTEEQLLEIYQAAREKGLSCVLITDAGRTEFNGVPTITCCAIGPSYPEDIDPITKELKLL